MVDKRRFSQANIPDSRAGRWEYLFDLGIARRCASLHLSHREGRSVRQYCSAVLVAVEVALEDLELPDCCVALVVDFYGEVDRDSFKLAEVQQAQEERDFRGRSFVEVD